MTWENQYIKLLNTKSEIIFPCRNNQILPPEQQRLLDKLQQFQSWICEPCSGSGLHLIEQAYRHPQNAYIGIELRFKRCFRTAEKAEKLKLTNLFMVRTSAQLINQIFAPHTLSGIYINFPDPWERKQKWRKHRLLNWAFLNDLSTLLKPEAFLAFKTDHAEYFDSSLKLIQEHGKFKIEKLSRDLHNSQYQLGNIETEFERLFLSKGQPIFMLEAKLGGLTSCNS